MKVIRNLVTRDVTENRFQISIVTVKDAIVGDQSPLTVLDLRNFDTGRSKLTRSCAFTSSSSVIHRHSATSIVFSNIQALDKAKA
jgi:hypothetical protein